MIDGLRSEDYKSGDVDVSDDLTVADLVSGTGLDLFSSTASAGGKLLSPVGTGSPTTTWGKSALAGAGATGAGSSAWHVFPTAFSAAPTVVASSTKTNEAILVPAGSIGVGSFYVETTSASQDFSWIAVEG